MKHILLFLLACCTISVFAQNAQQEINEQVWKPFIQSFNNHDTKAFMSVHSKDVVRSPRDSKQVWTWDEYAQRQERGDKRERDSGTKRQLELRFTERMASATQAVEVGVYKTSVIRKDGVTQSFYGKFHVVLRKENGTWKILVDTDSSENNAISEKDFLAAAAME